MLNFNPSVKPVSVIDISTTNSYCFSCFSENSNISNMNTCIFYIKLLTVLPP